MRPGSSAGGIQVVRTSSFLAGWDSCQLTRATHISHNLVLSVFEPQMVYQILLHHIFHVL